MKKYYQNDTIIYHNGHFVKAADARIDLYSQTMHYGYGVFEGIRSYAMADGTTQIFKAQEHFARLAKSSLALNMPYHFDADELIDATYKILQRNELKDAYIRPMVYAPSNMSFQPNAESHIVIEAWEMAPFLGEQLLRVMISSFERPNPRAFKIEAKATGHYVNSILASQEAKSAGYDEALLMDSTGHVAEAPGANFFMEHNGTLKTPAAGHILPGITRATVLELCSILDIPVEETTITPEMLLSCDSAFFCGTAAEVIGIQSINERQLPKAWSESHGHKIQKAYKSLVTGKPIYQTNQILKQATT